jgi:hypothetical protein
MADSNVGDLDLFGQAISKREPFISRNGISQNTLTGRYAEFMVCAYLTRMGYNVMHVDAQGYDVILEHEHRSYRIDVKATANMQCGPRASIASWRIHNKVWRNNSKVDRPVTPQDTDLLALFHLELNVVLFYPVVEAVKGSLQFPLGVLRNSGDGQASLEAAIKIITTR